MFPFLFIKNKEFIVKLFLKYIYFIFISSCFYLFYIFFYHKTLIKHNYIKMCLLIIENESIFFKLD